MAKLQLRLYKCTGCGAKTMHTTNHTGEIYPWCGVKCDTTRRMEYVEDVRVITLDTSKRLTDQVDSRDWYKIVQAIGRLVPADNGRRVYITSDRAQVESLDQMRKRKGV